MEPRPRPSLALAALFLVSACGSTGSADEVVRLIRSERYDAALALAAERAEKSPDDGKAQRLHLDATVAWLLERGRNAVFERRYEDALDEFNQALALAPDNGAVVNWIMKTRDELTVLWLDRGLEFLQSDEFDQAIQAYELAEYYTPRDPEALFGATRVLFLINYRQGMGEDYYNQGVRAVHEHFLTQARHKFAASNKYNDGDLAAQQRRERVEAALAEERLYVARGFEAGGNYGAAQVEYRVILKLEPDNAQALAGMERMNAEVAAGRLLGQADKLIRQKRFDEALEKLQAGRAITLVQDDHFSRMTAEIEVAHWQALYERGLDEERDFRYDQAIATYAELLAAAEFYEDAEQRKKTLEEYVKRAADLYAQLEAAESPEAEEAILRQFEVFWPEYKDVGLRLAAIED
jgi:tetratricopeptide (TPR) repeat protein